MEAVSPTAVEAAKALNELSTPATTDVVATTNGKRKHGDDDGGEDTEPEVSDHEDEEKERPSKRYKEMSLEERIEALKQRLKDLADGQTHSSSSHQMRYFSYTHEEEEEPPVESSRKKKKKASTIRMLDLEEEEDWTQTDPDYKSYDNVCDDYDADLKERKAAEMDTSIGLLNNLETNNSSPPQSVVWGQEKKWKRFHHVPKKLVIGRGRFGSIIQGTKWRPDEVVTLNHRRRVEGDGNPHIRADWWRDWVFKFPQWKNPSNGSTSTSEGGGHFQVVRIMPNVAKDEWTDQGIRCIIAVLKKGGYLQVVPPRKRPQKGLTESDLMYQAMLEHKLKNYPFEPLGYDENCHAYIFIHSSS